MKKTTISQHYWYFICMYMHHSYVSYIMSLEDTVPPHEDYCFGAWLIIACWHKSSPSSLWMLPATCPGLSHLSWTVRLFIRTRSMSRADLCLFYSPALCEANRGQSKSGTPFWWCINIRAIAGMNLAWRSYSANDLCLVIHNVWIQHINRIKKERDRQTN